MTASTTSIPVAPSGDGAKISERQELLVRAEAAAQRRLIAERNKERATQQSEQAREDVISTFKAAGVTELPVDDEGIVVIPTTQTTVNEDAIEAYVKRYAPEHYDAVFVPARKLDTTVLKALVGQGKIGRTALSHIQSGPGTPRVSRYKVK
jgi:hypothetical protein